MSGQKRENHMVTTLLAAVPLWYHDLGLPDTFLQHSGKTGRIAEIIASKGDILQFGGKKGEVAEVFNEMAKGLAILSAVPGGVKVFGYHWIEGQAHKIEGEE